MLLIGGDSIDIERQIHLFTILVDLSGLTDTLEPGVNATTIFVQNSLRMFKTEEYDEWIEYYKGLLLKENNYELIQYLSL